MEVLQLSLLQPYDTLPFDLYHASGNILLRRGTPLKNEDIEAFRSVGIEKIYALSQKDSSYEFRRSREFRSVPVDELPRGTPMPGDLVVGGRQIAPAGAPITDKIIEDLKESGVNSIFVKRPAAELEIDQYQQVMTRLAGYAGPGGQDTDGIDIAGLLDGTASIPGTGGVTLDFEPAPPAPAEPEKKTEKPATPKLRPRRRISREEVEQKLTFPRNKLTSDPRWSSEMSIKKVLALGGAVVNPVGDPLASDLVEVDPRVPRGPEVRDSILRMFDSAIFDLEKVFDLLLAGDQIEGDLLGSLARSLISSYVEDRCLVLNLVNLPVGSDPLLRHSVDSAIISIAMGAHLGFSADQVLEITFGALLHDIGMHKVDEAIRSKQGKLQPDEWGEIREHPVYNLGIIRQIKSVPKTAPILAYQIHERIDRSGYPLHQPLELIHTYSKIVAVADVYAAMIKERPYRRAFSPVEAVREVVRIGVERKFDVNTVRAFLFSVCYFPVGSMVKLSDDRTAKVVAPGEIDYTRPVIAVLGDSPGGPSVVEYINLSVAPELGIVEGFPSKPADREETFLGF
ncbi:MAG: HD domain-containing protein [Planctomycetota bacterium]|nr:MAG: HD domain-containing protein [Planctomycetota bacterium]